jgi:hypothetical protein
LAFARQKFWIRSFVFSPIAVLEFPEIARNRNRHFAPSVEIQGAEQPPYRVDKTLISLGKISLFHTP